MQQHATDSRPAWLWSQDGQTLLWHNPAAELFLGKLKKQKLKLAAPAVPIKGQVARNIRLGSPGRTSLARIQFLAGEKPASSTCATTPLVWQDGQMALLVVGVDPIAQDILNTAADIGEPAETNPGPDPQTVIEPEPIIEQTTVISQEPTALGSAEAEVLTETETTVAADTALPSTSESADEGAYERELQNWREAESDAVAPFELAPAPERQQEPVGPFDEPEEPQSPAADAAPAGSRLSRLMEQLASDEALFTPLTAADDAQPEATVPTDTAAELLDDGEAYSAPEAGAEADADLAALTVLDGLGDSAQDDGAPMPASEELGVVLIEASVEAADPEAVERVSRYNFDELSRILNDRVGDIAAPPTSGGEMQRGGALINLGGETLVLNRLPLGILVFRDQQVLFANRAITEMVGYQSVEALREAGLAAVFPAAGPEGQEAGPVNHLVQRDGTLVPVTARLQSISWQGRPALMLSASATEVRTGHEAAVRAFAQTAAELRGEGFFEATRTGVVSALTPRGMDLLAANAPLEGKLLSALVAARDISALQEFLERPARFAESERPYLRLRAGSGKAELMLFAQGQAGVITNYFGFVRAQEITARLAAPAETDPALLARISRGVRRPLNTIIGFAELLRAQPSLGQGDRSFVDYARDIATAGQDIVALVDELDSYARLRDGRYLPQRSSIELTSFLESCVIRIRQQANNARVILRNAIAENLPRVTADRPSLEQAVLNLLASAIDQSPTGGAVVISAKLEEDGGIAVHVRDSSSSAVDMAERFVVFRDGPGRDGQMLAPVRSSVGLALTRSLLTVNNFSLAVDPAGERGLLFTLLIPADLVEKPAASGVAE